MSALPPGPRAPRAVQTAAWITRPGPFLIRTQRRFGDVFTIRLGGEPPWVMLAHPDAVREVFKGDPAVMHAGKANLILRPLVGHAWVLLLDGAQHRRQRKLRLPPFHGARMAGYRDLMGEIAREHIASWPRGESLPLAPRMQAITLDVVLRVIFGVDAGSPRLNALRDRLRAMLDRVLGGVSMLVAATHEDGAPMTDRELRDELVTLLVAGHETTATALSWTIERLTRYAPATTPNTGWDALRNGGEEYAEAAAKEALRLRPVLPVVLRNLQQSITIAGLDLPAGTVVAPSIYLVHRRPEIYPDPAAFRPERFLGPDPQGGTYTWIPFGGGVRRCLGAAFALLELRVVLAELGAALDAAAVDPAAEGTRRRAITMVPARGAEVVLS